MPSSSQSRMTWIGPAACAGTAKSSTASRAMKMVLRIGEFALAALGIEPARATRDSLTAPDGNRARHRVCPRVLAVRRYGLARLGAQRLPELWIVVQALQGGLQCGRIAGGDDEAGPLVRDQPARGGSYCVGGD